jgi:hypothetical protein
MVEVPDDLSHPMFCSMECAGYAGYVHVASGVIQPRSNWKFEWPPKLDALAQ